MKNKYFQVPHYLPSEEFYVEVRNRLKQISSLGNRLVLMSLDFDNFNYVNDLFGYEVGDLTLQRITEHVSSCLVENEIFSKLHADHFVFCLNEKDDVLFAQKIYQIMQLKEALREILPPHYHMVACSGIVTVKDDTSPLSALMDKANYARKKAKGNTQSSIRFYDNKMDEEVQWQKIVTCSMESAIKNREFEMYLQPKVLIKSDQIVGAEALVRWNSPKHGMIYPDQFIPIMEQNGFVRQLDFFMLEEACRFLKENTCSRVRQLPISVNFSKAHLSTDNLVEKIFLAVNQFGISTNLIEIEFTESLSSGDFEKLIEIVTDLKLLGFKVSLDDFGAAYSSLSCLKDLPIDIIKIDKGFLNSSANTERGKLIVAKVVELLKSLRLISVMEGVEDGEQVDFLKKLSCDLGQGYFYAKPMSKEAYVNYIGNGSAVSDIQQFLSEQINEKEKSYLNVIPQEFQMDNWELYTLGKNIDMGLMKGYLDGGATVQYVNDRALEYIGFTRREFREVLKNSIMAFTHPEDAPIVQRNAELLINTGKPLKFQTRAIRKDGKVIVLQGRSSCVTDNQGRLVGIYAFQDVTEDLKQINELKGSLEAKIMELEERVQAERKTRESLRLSEERYRLIVEQSEDIMFDWDFSSDTIFVSEKYNKLFGRPSLTQNLSVNSEIRGRIHPEDLVFFEQWVSDTFQKPGFSEAEYRIMDTDGNYIWMRCRSTAICDKAGHAVRAVGLLSNISVIKAELHKLMFKSQRDPLTKLLNKLETQTKVEEILQLLKEKQGAFFIIDIDNFKKINDHLGHQLGDTILIDFAGKLKGCFPENSIIGRIGGDEFAVYLQEMDRDLILGRANLLTQALRVNYYGSSAKYNISCSVGISLCPEHGVTFGELYHFADIALYESKHQGKDRYTLYNKNMTGTLQDSRTPVEWKEGFLDTYFQGDFPYQIFEMLYETKDMKASIQRVLELLGKQYQVDRVYVFQNDNGGRYTSNRYEWCAQGIPPAIDLLQNISLMELGPYLEQYSKEGVFC